MKGKTASNKGLSKKRAAFCREYVFDYNGTQAAIRAGYSKRTADRQAEQLLKKLEVKEEIKRLEALKKRRCRVKTDDVIKEIANLAFSSLPDFVDVKKQTVTIKDFDKLTKEQKACLSEISTKETAHGTCISFKLHSKTKALEMLGRHLGLFVDKHEVSGPDGGPIETKQNLGNLSKEELIQLLHLSEKIQVCGDK